MNCYLCDAEGKATPAVATCTHCGVGICKAHVELDAQQPRLRGMVVSACRHHPQNVASSGRGHVVAPQGRVPA